MRQYFLKILIVLCFTTSAHASWNETSRSDQQTYILNSIESLVEKTSNPVVIFDLDSTLYKNHERWAAIVREFAHTKEGKEAQVRIPLENFQASSITDSFDMVGLLKNDAKLPEDKVQKILPAFKKFWTEKFFNSDYVNYDHAVPGAIDYVNALYKKGATIVYITGRDAAKMGKGTKTKLKADGFPLNSKKALLMMKPESNQLIGGAQKKLAQSDTDWKSDAIKKVRGLGQVVASFDNEPAHINEYYLAFHQAGPGFAVWLDTDHFPSAPPRLKGVLRINGFLR